MNFFCINYKLVLWWSINNRTDQKISTQKYSQTSIIYTGSKYNFCHYIIQLTLGYLFAFRQYTPTEFIRKVVYINSVYAYFTSNVKSKPWKYWNTYSLKFQHLDFASFNDDPFIAYMLCLILRYLLLLVSLAFLNDDFVYRRSLLFNIWPL